MSFIFITARRESDFESDAIRRVFGTAPGFKKALNLAGMKTSIELFDEVEITCLFCG
jgi:hypothetical protein